MTHFLRTIPGGRKVHHTIDETNIYTMNTLIHIYDVYDEPGRKPEYPEKTSRHQAGSNVMSTLYDNSSGACLRPINQLCYCKSKLGKDFLLKVG